MVIQRRFGYIRFSTLQLPVRHPQLDTPTHGLIGRLVARTAWPDKANTSLVNLVTIASVLPDLDVFLPGDGLDSLQTHRGISHSFVGVAFLALPVAWIAHRWSCRGIPFERVYLVTFCGFILHILFDLATSYGTSIFLPISDYRAALDLLFIIDPYLDLILITGLVLGWKSKRLKSSGYRLGSILFAFYLLSAMIVSGVGHLQLRHWAAEHNISITRAAVMPTAFSPLHRRGIIHSEKVTYHVPLSLVSGASDQISEYVSARNDARLESVWQTRTGQIYGWFVRFPIVRPMPDDPENALLIQDLQFVVHTQGLGWLGGWLADFVQTRNPEFFDRRVFSLRLNLDSDGTIQDVIYQR